MNAIPEGIIVNSCQYTPVYLIQDPGDPQGRSYFVTQASTEEPKPVTDNLKTFYESSGNIENSVINVSNSHRPRIVRKVENCVVGNNLKLASFLQPKNENVNRQPYIVNNVVMKSNVTNNNTSCSTSTVNTVPRLNIDSKIVKLKNLELKTKYNRVERSAPKTKPKEPTPPVLNSAPTKLTSVQLLKLGETYHCLNQLSDEQMSKVTQALKIFSNPEKNASETTYDPVTNTKYLYKVVSAKDLAVVGNKFATTNKIYEVKTDNIVYSEQKDNFARETVKKDLFVKENCKKDTLKTEQRKDLIKTDFKKDLVRSDLRKDVLMKNELKKDLLVKNEMKKELMAKNEIKNYMLAKNELKKDLLTKNDLKKDILTKNDMKKEFMVKKDMMVKIDVKRDNATKKENSNKSDVKKESKNDARKEVKKNDDKIKQKILKEDTEDEDTEEIAETKVTRSGRKVKFPKLSLPEDSPHKPKKKTTYVTCFQCPAVFSSLYRLQKHYEAHPTHIPSRIHSNLFHCLLAIVKSGSEEDRTNIFIQQLEQLIVKLKSLLPCLMKNSDSAGKPCTISDNIGKLLGMEPGKYNFDIEALNCVKNKDGYCLHKPPPKEVNIDPNNQVWDSPKEDTNCEVETDDCARINSVEKWPTVNKRVWKQKKQKENAKRMRLTSENGDTFIELGVEDTVIINNTNCSNDCSAILSPQGVENKAETHLVNNEECNEFIDPETLCLPITESEPPTVMQVLQQPPTPCYLSSNTDHLLTPEPPNLLSQDTNDSLESTLVPPKSTNHLHFHSTHFDIRSSPIKTSSTVFRKFQINTEVLGKYEAHSMRSIESVDKVQESEKLVPAQIEIPQNSLSTDETLQEIFRDEDLSVVKESFTLDRELKDWILNRSNDEKSEDGFGKTDSIIEPALLHIKDHEIKTTINNEIEQKDVLSTGDNHDESSVLNFLDSLDNDCLSYPGTEIRTNNGDFQLDLFSFTSC